MQKKQLLLSAFFMLLVMVGFAQRQQRRNPSYTKYTYYISIGGVKSKADIIALESNISAKPGVYYFGAFKTPAKYFRLMSNQILTQQQLTNWIANPSTPVLYFGEGDEAAEKALIASKKHYQQRH